VSYCQPPPFLCAPAAASNSILSLAARVPSATASPALRATAVQLLPRCHREHHVSCKFATSPLTA